MTERIKLAKHLHAVRKLLVDQPTKREKSPLPVHNDVVTRVRLRLCDKENTAATSTSEFTQHFVSSHSYVANLGFWVLNPYTAQNTPTSAESETRALRYSIVK